VIFYYLAAMNAARGEKRNLIQEKGNAALHHTGGKKTGTCRPPSLIGGRGGTLRRRKGERTLDDLL